MKFDQRYEKYKAPFGAVETGRPVRFFMETDRDDSKITLRLWVDGREELISGAREEGGVSFTYTPAHSGIVWYYFLIDGPEGRRYYSGTEGEGSIYTEQPDSYQLTVYAPYETPDWFKNTIVYQIFPDRFRRQGGILGIEEHTRLFGAPRIHANWSDSPDYLPVNGQRYYVPEDFFGGNLYGVKEKLPYLKSLGVGCIYLNPIFLSSTNHRYNTADYMTVDPMLGGDSALAELAAAAKKYGIRLMLDGVFSHTGSESVYFKEAQSNPHSPCRDWYDFTEYPDKYRCWWGFETLPEVQEDSPSYIDFVCGKGGVIDTWLGLGASSFRLDVADELPDAFIERIRQAVKAHGEDKLLIGEVWEDATTKEAFGRRRTYLHGKGLDAVMNYPFRNAALSYVTGGDVHTVAEQILSICENYPAPALNCAMNFLSTHDTERAITAIAGEPANGRDRYWQSGRRIPAERMDDAMRKLLLGYAMIFTLPGVPCIYYGDEIAMQGYGDPFNRAFFDWNSTEQRLRGPLKTLAHLRKGCDAFDGGRLEIVRADTDVLHYRRIGKTQTAEIILNRGPHLIAELAFGKYAEVNPGGFTVLVEENHPEHVGYFSIY